MTPGVLIVIAFIDLLFNVIQFCTVENFIVHDLLARADHE